MKFKLQLSFTSLVKFTSVLGLCFGVGSVPLVILLNLQHVDGNGASLVFMFLFAMIVTPIAGALNGALTAIVGYPLYKWLSSRVGLVYEGNVYGER